MSRLTSIELLILIAVWRASCQQELIVNQISQQAVSQAAKQIGEQIGLALLDSLLQKGQEEVARQALQRQIELLEDINPPYAKLLKQIPPETIVSAALLQRQQLNGPAQDTGNPLLNVLAKNGIVAQGITPGQQNATQQIGNVFQKNQLEEKNRLEIL
uniref:Uncharacterized protein n=1 Tax=Romanomermis culicivorax TaxID=13658 RepID=A0A915J669_ROMCU